MKKLYFFSKEKLQFVEIQNYKPKLFVYFSLAVITFSSLLFGGYFYLLTLTGNANTVSALKSENKLLSNKLTEIMNKYGTINNQIDSLAKYDYQLRLVSNLTPISDEERLLGVGGGSFDNSVDYLSDKAGTQLKDALRINLLEKLNLRDRIFTKFLKN